MSSDQIFGSSMRICGTKTSEETQKNIFSQFALIKTRGIPCKRIRTAQSGHGSRFICSEYLSLLKPVAFRQPTQFATFFEILRVDLKDTLTVTNVGVATYFTVIQP